MIWLTIASHVVIVCSYAAMCVVAATWTNVNRRALTGDRSSSYDVIHAQHGLHV